MIDLKRFQKLKGDYEACRREMDRLRGAIDQKLERLEELSGTRNTKSVKKILVKLKQKLEKDEKDFERMADDMELVYGEILRSLAKGSGRGAGRVSNLRWDGEAGKEGTGKGREETEAD